MDKAESPGQVLDAKGRAGQRGSGAQAGPHASHVLHGSGRPRELGSGVRAHPAHKPTRHTSHQNPATLRKRHTAWYHSVRGWSGHLWGERLGRHHPV